ncbi:unnamed protein product [Rotaria sp. Silwood2]|nr:unnamed protein product [Rotaria sp. Silwood2]CAF2927107.1 unnamed protein product [Rotaria sp. Silwood2]CAF3332018.1 unnamed protein product [Rotaria sp. Silwood2]CAF3916244.1 unnamed protein product [Rotaria sp. Silwood2]CAF4098572.1 unnamed protein product [Rotaria sp. Silwood2]
MNFGAARATFNQRDVNRDGYIDGGELNQWGGGAAGIVNYQSSAYNSSGYGVDTGLIDSGLSSYESSAGYGAGSGYAAQTYPTDAQGLYQDPNPLIIRRPMPVDVQPYKQKVIIRYLQPPPIPPPGPLIIKEVRPPQPPAPPPLIIRQQAPPLPTPSPLVLRQRPPNPPPAFPAQNFIRR